MVIGRLTCILIVFCSQILLAQTEVTGTIDATKVLMEELRGIPDAVETAVPKVENKSEEEKDEPYTIESLVSHLGAPADPSKYTYFLEVKADKKLNILRNELVNGSILTSLVPGQILMVEDDLSGFVDKLEVDRKGLGAFKPIRISPTEEADPTRLLETAAYVFDEALTAVTLNPHAMPVKMIPMTTAERPIVTVYTKPVRCLPKKDCVSNQDFAIGWLDKTAAVQLVGTRLIFNDKEASQSRTSLYYNVKYEYTTSIGELKRGTGWVDSSRLRRKIEIMPVIAKRKPASIKTPPKDKSYTVFKSNIAVPDKLNRFTKDMTEGKARALASIWDVSVAWDFAVDYNFVDLKQSFLDKSIEVTGPGIQGFASVPIFLDLVMKGSVKATLPATSSESSKQPILLKAEQSFQFSTPLMVGSSPLQIGIGGYYFTTLNVTRQYGVNSLVGLQLKLLYETDFMWAHLKYAPVGNDLSFEKSNREVTIGVGYKMEGNSYFDNWGIYGENSNTYYKSPAKNTTTVEQTSLGVMIFF